MQFRAKGRGAALVGIIIAGAVLAGCNDASESGNSSGASSATASAVGTVALSAADYQVAPASSAIITVNRAGSGTGNVSVTYGTVNGTAVSGEDFTPTSGTLTWADGDTTAKLVLVAVTNSAAGKSFSISLNNLEGQVNFGNPASATIIVQNIKESGSSSGTSTSSSSGAHPSSSSSGTTSSSSGTTSSSSGAHPSSSSSGTTSSSSGTTSSSSGAHPTSSSSGTTSSSSGSAPTSSSSGSGTGSVTISWVAPTENTNGTALTNLAGYNIYYGTTSNAMTNKISLKTVGMQTYVISQLAAGNWYFALTAVNSSGVESIASSAVEASL